MTQIVLGAAVGEAVLGRRLGNRAMLWGGFAGTIPDLDVLANLATDPVSALVYHRSFTHSIAFSVLAAPLLGWATYLLYAGGAWRKRLGPLLTLAGLFFLLLWLGSEAVPLDIFGLPQVASLISLAVIIFFFVVGMGEFYRRRPARADQITPMAWTGLFFAAIVTHPLLDACTMYGTQLLQPFSSERVGLNNIAVVDIFYTLPFLVFLLLAARRARRSSNRRRLNRLGLLVSSAYLLLTFGHHWWVGHILNDSLQEQGIAYERSIHGPTILTNFLWQATAESADGQYYMSDYSLFDQQRSFQPFRSVAGQHQLLEGLESEREVQLIRYFTKDYLGVIPLPDGRLQLNDLRYGSWGDDPADPEAYLFRWVLDPAQRPVQVEQVAGPPEGREQDIVATLWNRIKGI